MIFELKSDLPQSTQDKIDAIQAIPSAQRTTTQTAFLTSLAPYLTNLVISVGEDGLITSASGLTVPTGYAGFRKGATFIKTDATTKGMYENVGSTTVATWDLLGETSGTDLQDGSVTLAKMANMATASLIYRKTASAGVPEVNTVATLKTDLGLTGNNSGDQTITLSGAVSGTGTSGITTTIGAGQVHGTHVATNLIISFSGLGANASGGATNATVTGVAAGDILLFAFNVTDSTDDTARFASTANGANTISQLNTDLSAKTLRFLLLSQQA